MITLKQALETLKVLEDKKESLHPSPGCPISNETILPPKYLEVDREIKVFRRKLAAMPHIYCYMKPWMIDIHGEGCSSAEMSEEIVGDALFSGIDHLNDVISERSQLAYNIRKFLGFHEYTITDSGFGACAWHLGVPCSDHEAFSLITLLHMNFQKPIEAGLIYIDRHFWGFKFYDWSLPKELQ